MPTDPSPYIFSIVLFASLGASISTLEWIHGRRQLKDDGLFSWEVIGSRSLTVGPRLLSTSLYRLLSFRPFVGILILRLFALLLLPFALWFGHGSAVVLALVVCSSLAMHLRSPWGMDGSDQMFTQIFGALFLGQLGGSPLSYKASLWYIAGQSCLSYLTAGIAKAESHHWHGTNAVFAVFNTRTYGYEPVARFLLHRPDITRILTWGAVIMECSFSLALVAGFPGCLIFLAWGVAFHLMNAVVMGLNSFFWSFVATYPAIIYCAVMIERAHGNRGSASWVAGVILLFLLGFCARRLYGFARKRNGTVV